MSFLGRPKKSEKRNTRKAILDASLELFSKKSFSETSMREIARDVGITEAAIYSHFKNKHAILDALYEDSEPQKLLEFFEKFDKVDLVKDPQNYLTDKLGSIFGGVQDNPKEEERESKLFKIHQTELFRADGIPSEMIAKQKKMLEETVFNVFQFLIDQNLIHPSYREGRVLAIQILSPLFLLRLEEFTIQDKKKRKVFAAQRNEVLKHHLEVFLQLVLKR